MRVREKPKRFLPARRGSAGPFQKKAPDESGAEDARGDTAPDVFRPLSASWVRSVSEEP
jgi:hypothetical protein